MEEPRPMESTRPPRIEIGAFAGRVVQKWGFGVLLFVLLILLFVWPHRKTVPAKTTASATSPPQSIPAPPANLIRSAPVQPSGANTGNEIAGQNRGSRNDVPPPDSGAVSPIEQARQQMLEQRRQFELKAAFTSSTVILPKVSNGGPKPGISRNEPDPDMASDAEMQELKRLSQRDARDLERISANQGERDKTEPAPAPNHDRKTEAALTADRLAFSRDQKLYMLPEHTLIRAVLESAIESGISGPVDALVSIDVYLPNSRTLIIPQGARLIGETSQQPVFGQKRLAVVFHRILIYPPGATKPYSISLDKKTPAESQQGTVGLDGKVNNHIASSILISLAAASISGISQLGSYNSTYSPASGFYNGVAMSASQNSSQILERFLNRAPTISVPGGKRMEVQLLGDVDAPEYPGVM